MGDRWGGGIKAVRLLTEHSCVCDDLTAIDVVVMCCVCVYMCGAGTVNDWCSDAQWLSHT